MRKFFTPIQVLFYLLLTVPLSAQLDVNLLSLWDYQRPNSIHEKINDIITVSNGRIIAVGETLSPNKKDLNGLVLVLNAADGGEIMRRSFGGAGDDSFNAVVQNHDGTFTLVGYTNTDKKNGKDGWIVQIDLEANLLFEAKPYSKENRDDELKDVTIDQHGMVLAVGSQKDRQFNMLWVVNVEGGEIDDYLINNVDLGFVEEVVASPDGGFVMVGSTHSYNRTQPEDVWVLKIDKQGKDIWGGIKYFGDTGFQEGLGISNTMDGGYVIAGVTTTSGAGQADKWVLKLNKYGKLEWEKTYGKAYDDFATSILALSEGGFAIFGQTKSYMLRASTSMLELLVIDEEGTTLDSQTYPIIGGEGDQIAHALTEAFTGEIIIAGNATSPKSNTSTMHIGAITYKAITRRPTAVRPVADNPDLTNALAISNPVFFDGNKNTFLEVGERGYLAFEVRNQLNATLNNITVNVTLENNSIGIEAWKDVKVGTLRPGQAKKAYIPLIAKNNLAKGTFRLTIHSLVEGKPATTAETSIKTNQPDPPKLMVTNYQFYPESQPRPGEEIVLKITLANTGGLASGPLEIGFVIPSGVIPNDAERLTLPSISPNEEKSLNFSFSYSAAYQENTLPIAFEAKGLAMTPVHKRMELAINNAPIVTNNSTGPIASSDEMLWISPDPIENQSKPINVNERELDIRILALSLKLLDRTNFGTIVNGQLISGQKMDEVTLVGPSKDMGRNRYTFKDNVRLIPGMNTLQVIYKEAGLEFKSLPLTVNYIPKGMPSLYVLSIGVAHDDLKYTVQDAEDIAKEFLTLGNKNGRGFKNVDVRQMTKEAETTTINIRKAFADLKRKNIKDNDLVVIFISSHGKVSKEDKYILIPSDFEPQYEEETSVNFKEDILDPLRSVDGKILVFIDACHSGNAISGGKNFSEEAESKFMNDLINKTSGLEIIASCSDNEFSYEDDHWQNGAFTEAILEAFNDQKVNINGKMVNADIYNELESVRQQGSDGIITIEELRRFIEQRVPQLVNSVKNQRQTPSHKSTELLPKDTPIFMVNRKQ
ncbi:MAG: caspase family protein [Saprospiraceae bacterium]